MRWIFALSLLLGCASSTTAPMDAGVDLTVGHCDPQQVFAACSAQCGMPICIVASATCAGTSWICDCSLTGPCRATDLGPSD